MEGVNKIEDRHYEFLLNSMGFRKKIIDNHFNNLKDDERIDFLAKIDDLIEKDNAIRKK
jgi:hypothetical protein